MARIDRSEKNWKFNPGDIEERNYWDEYLHAYEETFRYTSTAYAPWYIVPADNKWFARIVVATILADKLVEMDPQFPSVSEEDRQEMLKCRESLVTECGGDAPPPSLREPKPVGKKNKGKKRKSKKDKNK